MDVASSGLLERIPFLRSPLGATPILTTLQFYVQGDWHCWVPIDGKVVEMQMRPHEADYLGDQRERDTDQCFSLLDLVAQRTLDKSMLSSYRALWNDFQGLSASLAKVRLFYANRDSVEYGIRRCVQTEIENLAVLCRSIFDVLQVLARSHIQRTQMLNGPQPQTLPDSFRKMVLRGDIVQTAEQIEERYRLPLPIGQWYARQAPFFVALRTIRDRIIHNGSSVELVFSTERGFAVFRHDDPFDGLYEWPTECELPNSLVPIRPVMALMASRTLYACDDFAATFLSSIQMQEPVAPGMQLFTRGTNDREFLSMDAVIDEACWDDE